MIQVYHIRMNLWTHLRTSARARLGLAIVGTLTLLTVALWFSLQSRPLTYTDLTRHDPHEVYGVRRSDLASSGNHFGLIVIARQDDLAKVHPEAKIDEPLATKLRTLDYSRQFAVVVYRLLGGTSSEYTAEIRQIVQSANGAIVVDTHFGDPDLDSIAGMLESTRYHAVAVDKEDGAWSRPFLFVLRVDGELPQGQLVFIP